MFVDNNLQGVVPGLADPAIYIGVVEKGWAMLELSVQGEQKVRQCSVVGVALLNVHFIPSENKIKINAQHSSTPPRHSAPGLLGAAVSRLEQHRAPAQFGAGPEADTMTYLAPHMDFVYRYIN